MNLTQEETKHQGEPDAKWYALGVHLDSDQCEIDHDFRSLPRFRSVRDAIGFFFQRVPGPKVGIIWAIGNDFVYPFQSVRK